MTAVTERPLETTHVVPAPRDGSTIMPMQGEDGEFLDPFTAEHDGLQEFDAFVAEAEQVPPSTRDSLDQRLRRLTTVFGRKQREAQQKRRLMMENDGTRHRKVQTEDEIDTVDVREYSLTRRETAVRRDHKRRQHRPIAPKAKDIRRQLIEADFGIA